MSATMTVTATAVTSLAPLSLPVIDISPLLDFDGTPSSIAARSLVASQMHAACLKFGFYIITGLDSVVSREDMQGILDQSRAFFARPEVEKAEVKIRKGDSARGWQRPGINITSGRVDHQEGYDLYRPVKNEDPTMLLHGPNLWPSQPAAFHPTVESWVEKMQVIGRALMEATALGLGLDLESEEWAQLKQSTEETFWVTRCIRYPSLPKDAPGISCGAHKDYGLYTLLHADATPGALQVFIPSSDSTGPDYAPELNQSGTWINADPIPGAFVVNIGDMWEVWTNGLYRATLHRVIHQGLEARISVPFFYEPNFDAVVQPLPSAVRLQRELAGGTSAHLMKPVLYGEHLGTKVKNNFTEV